MFRTLIYLVSFVLVLGLVSDVQAATVYWTDTVGDHNWFTPTNWDSGTVPTPVDDVRIKMLPGPTIANEGAVADTAKVGNGSAACALTVDGGTLTVIGNIRVASAADNIGTLNMISGTIYVGSDLSVGVKGFGTLNMAGGTITVTSVFQIPSKTGTGHVDLDGGIITANNLEMRPEVSTGTMDITGVGTMDIRAGMLIIDGNNVSTVQGYIDDPNGWITAYDGNGTLQLDYDVTNKGKTTLKAVHLLNPNPADGSNVTVSANQLQWTLPEPNLPGGVVTCDVYFGTNPNIEANPKVVDRQTVESVSVTLAPRTTYYWALDLYDSSISTNEPYMYCPIFTFNTENQPPIVNAGADMVTWLVDGVSTKNLDATVTDDGAISPYTVQWTVVSEPNVGTAVIETATAEDTSITLSAMGEYVLQLEAFDGEYTGSDTLTISVFSDHCEAAKSLPGWIAIPGDLNLDCVVDQLDMDILNEHLLECNGLDCPDPNAL